MTKRQTLSLCLCNIVIFSGIGGLVGLLPILLKRLGADPAGTGLFIALAYLSLSLSNFFSGWLAARFQRRKLFLILGGLLGAPAAALMSRFNNIPPLLLFMTLAWFATGITMTMVTVLGGLTSAPERRGRSFGLLSVSAGLGLTLGSWASGPITDHWGFPALFIAVGLFYLVIPAAGLFVENGVVNQPGAIDQPAGDMPQSAAGVYQFRGEVHLSEDLTPGPFPIREGVPSKETGARKFFSFSPFRPREGGRGVRSSPKTEIPPGARAIFNQRTFRLLFTASILAQAANVLIFVSRALLMNALHFDLTSISRASAIGTLVTLPLPLVVGWLADRFGRKPLILACLAAPVLALLVQAFAWHTWQFTISSIISTVVGINGVVGSAMLSDIFPAETRGPALSFYNATPWIGIVIGLTAGGLAMNAFQIRPALLLATLPAVIAVILFSRVKE